MLTYKSQWLLVDKTTAVKTFLPTWNKLRRAILATTMLNKMAVQMHLLVMLKAFSTSLWVIRGFSFDTSWILTGGEGTTFLGPGANVTGLVFFRSLGEGWRFWFTSLGIERKTLFRRFVLLGESHSWSERSEVYRLKHAS